MVLVREYEENINKLFNEWIENSHFKNGEVFVKDGVINPDVFYSSNLRPLFLLKEAYGKSKDDCNIAEEHNCNTGENCIQKNKTWPNISRWTYALMNTTKEKSAEYVELDCFKYKKNEYLQRIAVVNIKKLSGTSISISKNLKYFVKQDAEKLRSQIEIIKPTVIVCGYTLSYLKKILNLGNEYDEKFKKDHFARIKINGENVLVLDCYHPSNWKYTSKQLFNMLVEVYQKSF